MQDFRDRVAVITGAASGIGRALASRCALEGMKLVLADLDASGLSNTVIELQTRGTVAHAIPTDVSKAEDVAALARRTLDIFGSVDLLFNNAGVAILPTTWETSLAEWRWLLGVNLWGVIHGIHYFVPIMLNQASGGHIVNTASMAGLISEAGLGAYKVSKFGVVTLSETLYLELAERKSPIKVSVLCPAPVNTNIMENSAQARPQDRLQPQEEVDEEAGFRTILHDGSSPDDIAECVFTALREERFYILPHPGHKEYIQLRMEDILFDRNPTNPWA